MSWVNYFNHYNMKTKKFLFTFLLTFVLALAVSTLVTASWNYFIKSDGFSIAWETSFRTAFILAFVIPFTQLTKNKNY